MRKVITYGTYDLLHRGHVRLLERAKALGDYLVVGVTADGFDKVRGKINVSQTLNERMRAVQELGIADEVIVERMSGRRTCPDCGASYHVVNSPSKVEGVCDKCGAQLTIRKDDEPEVVKARLVTYHKETEPLKDFYAKLGKLKTVDNQPSIAQTSEEIFRVLGI